MPTSRLLAALCLAVALAGCERPRPARAAAAAPELRYVEALTGGARADRPLPLVVAIHGLGDEPERFVRLFDDLGAPARVIAPRGPDAHRVGFSWFPIEWDARGDGRFPPAGIRRAAERLAQLLATLLRRHPTCGRPIVTGFSQGGILTFTLAALRPDLLGHATPVAGLLPQALWPAAHAPRTDVPEVRALHGAADAVVPTDGARAAVAALRRAGFVATLREYPGVGHTLGPEMARDWRQQLAEAVRAAPCPR